MQELRQGTTVIVKIGPAVDSTGVTPVTGLTIDAADEAEILKANTTATLAIGGTLTAISGCDGWYNMTLASTDVSEKGMLTVIIQDDSAGLPIYRDFMVVDSKYYDNKYSTTLWNVNLEAISGDTTAADNIEAAYDGTGYAGGTILQKVDVDSLRGGTQSAADLKDFADSGYEPTAHIVTFTNVSSLQGSTQSAADLKDFADTGYNPSTHQVEYANVTSISGDSAAADNLELAYDGTGYAGGTILPKVDVDSLRGGTQSATDLKDFADTGYDPATHKVETVKTADVITTYTGNTVQTGDGYAVVTNVTYGNSAIKNKLDGIEGATFNTATDSLEAIRDRGDAAWITGSGGDATAANQTTIINHLTAIKGSGFTTSTDSLEAIRDRGDAAWVTGGGGSGANTVTITVNDGAAAIQDVDVQIWDSANTSFVTKDDTNASGVMTTNLNDGTYTVRMLKAGYAFSNQTLVVSGNTSATYSGSAYVIGTPAGTNTCRVYEYCYGLTGASPLASVTSQAFIKVYPYDDGNKLFIIDSTTGTYGATTGTLYWDVPQGATVQFVIKEVGINLEVEIPNTISARLIEI